MRAAAVCCALPSYRLLTLGFARWRDAAAAAAAEDDDDDDVAAGDDAAGDDADGDAGIEGDMKNILKTHSTRVLVIAGHELGDDTEGARM